jgi:hypothetical protein
MNETEQAYSIVTDLMRKIGILNHYNQIINLTCLEVIESNSNHKTVESLAKEIILIHNKLLKENFKTINEKEMH